MNTKQTIEELLRLRTEKDNAFNAYREFQIGLSELDNVKRIAISRLRNDGILLDEQDCRISNIETSEEIMCVTLSGRFMGFHVNPFVLIRLEDLG
jgi:hypothetical protein